MNDKVTYYVPDREQPSTAAPAEQDTSMAHDAQSLTLENIRSREGNYLFTFGFPRAGKSTFQCYLTRFMLMGREDGRPSGFAVSRIERDDQSEMAAIVNEWRKVWQNNGFPDSTPVSEDDIRELGFTARVTTGKRESVSFSFLEVSGELFRAVSPQDRQSTPYLSPILRAFLENDAVKLIIVLVVDPIMPGEENDGLFHDFLEYLSHNHQNIMSQNHHLLILIPQPSVALKALKDRDAKYRMAATMTPELAEDYVRVMLPSTYGRLEVWETMPFISTFDLGEAVERENGKAYIKKLDMKDSEKVFRWICNTFHPGIFEKKLWQRVKDWVRE